MTDDKTIQRLKCNHDIGIYFQSPSRIIKRVIILPSSFLVVALRKADKSNRNGDNQGSPSEYSVCNKRKNYESLLSASTCSSTTSTTSITSIT